MVIFLPISFAFFLQYSRHFIAILSLYGICYGREGITRLVLLHSMGLLRVGIGLYREVEEEIRVR